ncbi:MAG: hypothetical protein WCD89_11885 [Anaerocolumna sp.]
MGKLIICNGRQADKPFYFKLTDTSVYSIEELCYYFYHNIEIIHEDLFDQALLDWIREDLKLGERADKLLELLDSKAGLKDYVVCVLCSADYYSEAEIKKLILIMDELEKLTPIDKKKKKADNYMKYRQFTEAALEYENILNSQEAEVLDSIRYGNLVHNLALAQINTIGLTAAADSFKEAYERNHNKESLRQYFYTLIMSKQEERLKQEVLNYGTSQDFLEEIQSELRIYYEEAEASADYQVIGNLLEYKDAGKIVQFYEMTGDTMNEWKQVFRRENS